jgi:hypothetical protein
MQQSGPGAVDFGVLEPERTGYEELAGGIGKRFGVVTKGDKAPLVVRDSTIPRNFLF